MPRGYIPKLLLMIHSAFGEISDADKRKWIMRINLITFLFIISLIQVSAATFGQKVSLPEKMVTMEKAFREIRRQTGYDILIKNTSFNMSREIPAGFKEAALQTVLDQIVKGTNLSYVVEDHTIVVKEKEAPSFLDRLVDRFVAIDVRGRVLDEQGEPLVGATVTVKGTNRSVMTGQDGAFFISGAGQNAMLVIRYLGYEIKEVAAIPDLRITMQRTSSKLDEVQVIAYGTTTQRLNTGSVGTITRANLESQPVSNPLEALYGRVPGLVVTSTSGIPGSAVKVQLRGRTSINSNISNDPLFIIDGIPFAANNDNITGIGRSAAGAVSPFASISPDDIERIDVLKDADATAIYGSRGSNGVILIQTKRGQAGQTQVSAGLNTGWSAVTRTTDWMNTEQYVAMRKEAFKNDNAAMTNANAYDLLVWDTTRYTDLKKMLLGHTANFSNAKLSVTGGSAETQFLLSGNYTHQGMLSPGDFGSNRGAALFNINHSSKNQKLNIQFSGNYTYHLNNQTANDLSTYLNLPPNIPSLYNDNGELNWSSGGYSFNNPMAYLLRRYEGITKNLVSNLQIGYAFSNNLKFKTSLGYNQLDLQETSMIPKSAQDPALNPTGTSAFSDSNYGSVIIEPQLDYVKNIGQLRIAALIGGTWQSKSTLSNSNIVTGYTNDLLLGTPAAGTSSVSQTETEYRYAAIFGRVNLNYKDKYLLNLTGRRDGSSRFGPGRQFSNFGALGLGYLFTQEELFKSVPFLSYGKIRGSYGLTGNDKIGDYVYLSTYSPRATAFQGVIGLYPTGLPNDDYAWELNKKAELALELGFLNDRILLTTSYYNNRSGNQLINYALPAQTGATSIVANFPAKVQNSGLELELTTVNFSGKNFKWSSSFNLSLPKNKLIEFPNQSASTYSHLLIGEPLSIISGFDFIGINSENGLPEFRNAEGNVTTSPSSTLDRKLNLGNTDPRYYGGFFNEFTFKGWNVNFLLEFRKQLGTTIVGNMYSSATYPGTIINQPLIALERWTTPSSPAALPRSTTIVGSAGYTAINNMRLYGTNFRLGDASYVRMKNIALNYNFSGSLIRKAGLKDLKVSASAQNLFVITPYAYADPETQTLLKTAPLRTITLGILTTF